MSYRSTSAKKARRQAGTNSDRKKSYMAPYTCVIGLNWSLYTLPRDKNIKKKIEK